MSPRSLRVPMPVRRALIDHARSALPRECCGFVVGRPGRVMQAVPMDNAAASAVRYRIDDRAHIELRRALRHARPPLAILGVYHSHPAGAAWPSASDVSEALYPEWVHLVIGLGSGRPVLRGFQIRRGRADQISLRGHVLS